MKNSVIKFTSAAIVTIAVICGINIFSGPNKSGLVFANVIEQIRKAQTATYSSETRIGDTVMRVKYARKEPGLSWSLLPGNIVVISDKNQNKMINIYHSTKEYIERKFENPEKPDFFESMKSSPSRANEILPEEEIEGRIVQGFSVTEGGVDYTSWIDMQTGNLVRVEGRFPNAPDTLIVFKDFEFDVELDDALFDLTPPKDYTPREQQVFERQEATCQDLINMLRWWATNIDYDNFPPSLEPAKFMEMGMKMKQEGKLSATERTEEEKMQQMTVLTYGLEFVIMMRPENDWHYAGEGVKLGDAETAICWFRPKGSYTYSVIYGDLRLVEKVDPEDIQ